MGGLDRGCAQDGLPAFKFLTTKVAKAVETEDGDDEGDGTDDIVTVC